MDEATLTIGQVADRTDLNVSAIRYYEARGLLPKAERVGGRRRFPEDTLERLGVIDVAKRAGFALEDVRILLDASDRGEPAHEQLRALAERKLPDVEALLRRAEAMRDWLTAATDCDCETLDACGLFMDRA
ncbi:MAG: MerR family transcriptional regulator [Thermoleophilaceae bacterium]|nr:MerR family transcriptional regulator [Thermoleophilaceae bacterium]